VLAAAAAVLTLGAAYVVADHLTADARRASTLYAHVFAGLADPKETATTEALLGLAREIRDQGIPLVITHNGQPSTQTLSNQATS